MAEKDKDPITRSIHNLVKLDGERLKFVPPVMFLKVEIRIPSQVLELILSCIQTIIRTYYFF